jgi:hypothetical protein
MLDAALAIVALSGVLSQSIPATQPPRDARPPTAKAGTAVIRGRVFNPDSGAAVRRANVMLMPVSPMPPPSAPPPGGQPVVGPMAGGPVSGPARTTRTDVNGQFEFAALAAGGYRIRVSPGPNSGGYLALAYGATGPRDPGRIIEIAEGQEFNDANVALMRAGAVTGRVVDDNGDPLSRVSVYVSRALPGSGTFQRTGGGMIQSDDHGRYRIYGLEPGDYIVTAESRMMGGMPIEGAEPEGFAPTHYPSTPQQGDAARIRVRAGADVEGVDIQMIRTRTYRISGSIVDSQGAAPSGRINAQFVVASGGGFSSSGVQVDGQGRFTIRDVVPGEYTLVVRPPFGEPTAPGAPPVPLKGEFASVPLSVSSDMDNVLVVMQPGVSVTGTLVFADGDPAGKPDAIRVMVQPASRGLPMFGPMPSATVGADGKFTLADLHGSLYVRLMVPRREWALQSVMLGATDITDTPVEFRKEHSGHLQIVISTRAAAIEGVVTGEDGTPAEQMTVLVFPEDKTSWRFGSPRIRTAVSAKEGRFVITGLVAGRYHAVAVPARSFTMSPDVSPEFFEALARESTRFVVAQDERRVVDLRVVKPPE